MIYGWKYANPQAGVNWLPRYAINPQFTSSSKKERKVVFAIASGFIVKWLY